MLLAHVAEIEPCLPGGAVAAARLQAGEEPVQLLAGAGEPIVGEPDDPRRRLLAGEVGPEQPPGGEVSGVARHHDPRNVELGREQRREQRPCPAEGDEGRFARVAPLFDGDLADRVGHARGGDRDHPARSLLG